MPKTITSDDIRAFARGIDVEATARKVAQSDMGIWAAARGATDIQLALYNWADAIDKEETP